MDDWLEVELLPVQAELEAIPVERRNKRSYREAIQDATSGVVRIDRPRWMSLGPSPLISDRRHTRGNLTAIRVQYQFETRAASTVFREAKCTVQLSHSIASATVSVYDLYPKIQMDDVPKTVSVAISPKIDFAGASLSLGSVSSDNILIGTVAPSVLGFTGEDERNPFWELRSTPTSPLRGIRTFWLVVESSVSNGHIRLKTQVSGRIESRWGIFSIRPVDDASSEFSVDIS